MANDGAADDEVLFDLPLFCPKRYTELPPASDILFTLQSWDTASKGGPDNDWSVCTTWIVTRKKLWYLVDVWRQRVDYPTSSFGTPRSTRDLLNTLAAITGRGAGFRSLGDTWADTTAAHGRLTLALLGGLAEFGRELIRARTGEGRERAKAQGVKMGPKFKLTDHQTREAIKRRDHGEESLDAIGRSYNVSGWTIGGLDP
jgi:Resolvase, N terminal domain